MTSPPAALFAFLIAAAAPAAQTATPPRPVPAPTVAQPVIQKQADLVVRCVGQRAPAGLSAKQRAMASKVVAKLRAGQDTAALRAALARVGTRKPVPVKPLQLRSYAKGAPPLIASAQRLMQNMSKLLHDTALAVIRKIG